MAYYADLYLTYFKFHFKGRAQYRADFIIMVVASVFNVGAQLVFLTLIFTNIQQLQGWSFQEMLLMYGLMITTLGLWNTFLDVPHRIHWYIQLGGLDQLLVRPPAILFQIAGRSGFNFGSLGRIAIGVAALVTALLSLQSQLPWWTIIYLPLAIISGSLIQFSILLLMACLSFWFTTVYSLLTTLSWVNHQFGQYPVTIFSAPLQFLLTWVLPFAMTSFYPVAFLLRGDEYRFYGLVALLMGPFLLGLALSFWRLAIRRYQSTGS